MKLIYKLTVAFFLLPLALSAQNADSLSLATVVKQTIDNYPAIKKAETELDAANARIGLANSAYLPDVYISSSYSRIGPAPSLTFPGLGTFQFYPADNYNATLNVNQSVYDFGKTSKNVQFEKMNKDLTNMSIEQVKQGLSQRVMGTYYSIVFLQEAVKIKDDELKTLNEHLKYVQKKAETGSATQYEILTTKVRISTIENQKTDILTSLEVQLASLNSFLGNSQDTKLKVKEDIMNEQIIAPADSLFDQAFAQRDEMKIARQKTEMAKTKYELTKIQNNPAINVFANGGVKNGYQPDLAKITPNFVVGVGLKIPIYDGSRTKYNKLQVKANMDGNDQDTEQLKRNIVNEVVESRSNALASHKKVLQSELQLQQAQQAYSLAETNFQAGAITNLDLLESYTNVAESKLGLLKTKIDYTVSILKLKIALGERIY